MQGGRPKKACKSRRCYGRRLHQPDMAQGIFVARDIARQHKTSVLCSRFTVHKPIMLCSSYL